MSTLTGSPIAAPDTRHAHRRPDRDATQARKRRAGAPARTSAERSCSPSSWPLLLVYSVLPLFWLLVNSTKTQDELFSSFGLWFSGDFALFDNIARTSSPTATASSSAGSATPCSTWSSAPAARRSSPRSAGYGLAKFDFPGKKAVFAVVLGAVAIPGTALAVPTFLMFSQLGLTNTPWAIILPSLISPFGLYLIWTYAVDSVPTEILEAARMDGVERDPHVLHHPPAPAEPRPHHGAALLDRRDLEQLLPAADHAERLALVPAHGRPQPVERAVDRPSAATPIYNLVITGSFLTIIPIVVAFLFLQRYWQSGLSAGGVKA